MSEEIQYYWKFDLTQDDWVFSTDLILRLGYDSDQVFVREELFAFNYKDELESELKEYYASRNPSGFNKAVMCHRNDGDIAMYVFRGDKINDNTIGGDIIPIQDHLLSLSYIEDSNLRMQLISEGFHTGIWDWNLLTGHEWWSDQFYRLLGYEPEEIEPTFQVFIEELIHPEDKQAIELAIDEHLKLGKAFKQEVRLKNKSGEYRWFETSGKAAFKEGKAARMCGAIIEIHDKKLQSLK